MEQQEAKTRVAQPADEEIKKHGDQLAKQVRDAAGTQPKENPLDSDKQVQKD